MVLVLDKENALDEAVIKPPVPSIMMGARRRRPTFATLHSFNVV
jgi:hypothetical protein